MPSRSLANTVVFVLLIVVAICRPAVSAELPSCGVMSIYGVLKLRGKNASVREINQRLQKLRPAADTEELSLADIKIILESYGLSTEIIRTELDDPARISCPSILYVRPSRMGTRFGHVLILRSVSPDSACLQDLTQSNEVFSLSRSDLLANWDGELLLVSSEQISDGSALLYVIIVGSIAACFACLLFRRSVIINCLSRGSLTGLLLFFSLAVVSGCGERPSIGSNSDVKYHSTSVLTCRQVVFDAGHVRQGDVVSHIYCISTDRNHTKIRSMRASCACVFSRPDVTGATVTSQSSVPLEIGIRTHNYSGSIVGRMALAAEDDDIDTAPLYLDLKAFVDSSPRIVNAHKAVIFDAERDIGSRRQVTIELGLAYQRDKGAHPLEFVANSSSIAGFAIGKCEINTTERLPMGAEAGPMLVDDIHIFASRDGWPSIGPHTFPIMLTWRGLPLKTTGTYMLEVRHPVQATEEVYFGRIKPNTSRVFVLTLHFLDPKVRLISARCSLSSVTVDVHDQAHPVLTLHAPSKTQRLSGNVDLKFSPDGVEPLSIPVLALISEE